VLAYLAVRLGQGTFVLFGVATLAFFLIRATGDPTLLILGEHATPEAREELRRRMGWQRPLYVQYVDYVSAAARGDLGRSLYDGRPAALVYAERIPASFQLASVAMLVALAVSLPLAVGSLISRQPALRALAEIAVAVGQSMPSYWLGLLLIFAFSVSLGWLPSGGRERPDAIILPAVTLAVWTIARVTRLARAKIAEVVPQDYVRTAWAKGLSPVRVYGRHVLPNASIAIVTLVTAEFVTLFSAAILTESVFAWPGVGRLLAESVYRRDYPTVQAGLLVISGVVVVMNILTDALYLCLDPRIRLQ
jgi:peptide/nickel transport system permease protein